MPTFADKQGDQILQASQENINTGNAITSTEVAASRSKLSYPAHSLFTKFRSDIPRYQPKVKQTWWSRRRAAKVHPTKKSSLDRTIMSPLEEISRYGFATIDLEDDNGSNEDAVPITLTKLQQLHSHCVANVVAKYNPWDANSFVDRATMSPMQEVSLYSFVTNDLENNTCNEQVAPMSLINLQELHNLRISENAKYSPWDAGTIMSPMKELSPY